MPDRTGLNREFLSEEWDNLIPKKEWYGVVEEAQNMVCEDAEVQIQATILTMKCLKCSVPMRHLPAWKTRFISNAVTSSISARRKNTGFVVSNPPYGERLSDKKQMEMLYRSIGQIIKENDTWSFPADAVMRKPRK